MGPVIIWRIDVEQVCIRTITLKPRLTDLVAKQHNNRKLTCIFKIILRTTVIPVIRMGYIPKNTAVSESEVHKVNFTWGK